MAADNLILLRGSLKNLLVGGKDNMRRGEDIKLSDVLAFDVRVYDPTAPIIAAGGVAMNPGDPGYTSAGTVVGRGGFVDLGYANDDPLGTPLSVFSSRPLWKFNRVRTYCTWSTHYERDGKDQDRNKVADQGTNGLDDNNQGGVDDITERETTPPYPSPLRGISVSIRMLEFNTRQVRQISVATDFLPE